MRVVCISDTHGLHDELQAARRIPDGDVLVLAFNEFLGKLPHRYKLVIAGNHESTFDRQFYPFNWQHYGHRQQFDPDEVRALLTNGLYLEDQAVLIEGFKFYGTPWQPEFCNWAFNLPRGEKLLDKWRRIPSDTDVLVTHTPPLGRGDQVGHMRVGCEELAREVSERIRPQFHVFGHVHEGYGKSSDGTTIYMNASSCTHDYEAINAPFVFDLNVSKSGWIGATAAPLNGSSIASMVAAANCSVSDGGSSAEGGTAALDYALMLHEQLRVCSQKAPFVPKPLARGESSGAAADGPRRLSLREFRVDGTTSGLLLESTLKLRPVVGEQTRALRYLFHNGFSGRGGGSPGKTGVSGSGGAGTEAAGDGAAGQVAEDAAQQSAVNDPPTQPSARAGHRRPVLRRVTMAVLNHVSESKELTNAEIHELESFASTLAKASDNGDGGDGDGSSSKPAPGIRVRRSKTLQRREGLARLAPMAEEPEEKPASQQEAPPSVLGAEIQAAVQNVSAVTAVVEVTVVDPPAAPPVVVTVECTLCKYKVPGHVHPGASSSATPTASPPPPPATAAAAVVVECTLCKYNVPGHVHPGSVPAAAAGSTSAVVSTSVTTVVSASSATAATVSDGQQEAPAGESTRQKAVGSSRLSSWF